MHIIINKHENGDEYYSIDLTSGGYPYWSSSLSQAKIFKSYNEAEEALNNDFFIKECNMMDKTIYPPILIHSALKLCNTKKKGEGILTISKITFIDQFQMTIKGEIK